MPDELTQSLNAWDRKAALKCDFCKTADATLLCDGRLDDGRTCNANICRKCAARVSDIFLRRSRRDPETKSRCSHDTVDLCPRCQAARRDTNFGGMSEAEAKRVLGKETPQQADLFDARPEPD